MDWNEGLEVLQNQDDLFPHGKRLDYSNLTSYYYNTQDAEAIASSLITCVRGLPLYPSGGVYRIVASFLGRFTYGADSSFPIIDEGQLQPKFGSYFWDRDNTGIIYVDYSVPSKGSNHKTLFERLVAEGVWSSEVNWKQVPRGYTSYDWSQNIYVVIGGSWITEDIASNVCRAFGYDPVKYPWQVYVSREMYDIELI